MNLDAALAFLSAYATEKALSFDNMFVMLLILNYFRNLDSCILLGAIVSGVNLTNSNLRNANLVEANFNQSNLTNTNLTNTVLYETNFANANLSFAKGLLTIRHLRSSTIDHRTINKSEDYPKNFKRMWSS